MAGRYRDIRETISEDGIRYKINTIYPDIPLSEQDYYLITSTGERYDTLAQVFYNDYSLWWIIAAVNNSERASLNVEPGVQIRIPKDKLKVLELFNQENRNR